MTKIVCCLVMCKVTYDVNKALGLGLGLAWHLHDSRLVGLQVLQVQQLDTGTWFGTGTLSLSKGKQRLCSNQL